MSGIEVGDLVLTDFGTAKVVAVRVNDWDRDEDIPEVGVLDDCVLVWIKTSEVTLA